MSEALDRSVLDHLRAVVGDTSGQFAVRLVAAYGSQATELVEDLTRAADDRDYQRLSFAAHTLKGSSDSLGGRRLAGLCQELENWQGAPDELGPRVEAVRDGVTALRAALATYLSA